MSRIEQLIGEIEEYIDSCKYQPLSNTKILVNKEEMEELLVELRLRVPDEIKKYQKIISQQEAILADARNQAESMLTEAKNQTSEMVSEHEVMQQAYAKANELVVQAQAQADQIVQEAVNDANNYRMSAVKYTDEMLASLQTIISHSMEGAKGRFDSFLASMQHSYEVVSSNRRELSGAQPQEEQQAAPQAQNQAEQQNAQQGQQ